MPRKQRFYLPEIPAHVMQRGHNRSPIFFDDMDYLEYLKILKHVADHYMCQIHAYVLMTNHVHLLVTPVEKNSISLMFQSIGRLYVTYVNKTYKRSGTLWEGRHKGNIIETEEYFLRCMKYIENNPVRAAMVKTASEYQWSSYAANATGKTNAIINKHVLYQSLGLTKKERTNAYQNSFLKNESNEALENLQSCLKSGTPLGNEKFLKSIEKISKLSVGHRRQGRPIKRV